MSVDPKKRKQQKKRLSAVKGASKETTPSAKQEVKNETFASSISLAMY
jgi:hypothetical protein